MWGKWLIVDIFIYNVEILLIKFVLVVGMIVWLII